MEHEEFMLHKNIQGFYDFEIKTTNELNTIKSYNENSII